MNAAECRARAAELRAFGRLHEKYREEAERLARRFDSMAAYFERRPIVQGLVAAAAGGHHHDDPDDPDREAC
jgi:hypothetical protein